jgi:precorrin-2 dehydrogenase / sirohydrochlorin ferrochelatase
LETPAMVPVLISPANKHIVVFGGGNVALRKCYHFKGFDITVIAEHILPEIRDLASKVIEKKISADNCARYMRKAYLVIAATSSKTLNDSIRDQARARGISVNSAHGGGDLLIPSILMRDNYLVAVSSVGRAPAFPPYIIEKLDGMLGEDYDRMLALLIKLRPVIRSKIKTQPERAAFTELILHDDRTWILLRAKDDEEAYQHALDLGNITQ